jgi:hypothetical protein
MKNTNTTETGDKLTHGLFRLTTKLGWIIDMLLEGDEKDWILETVDEALEEAVELYVQARRAKVK